MFPIFGPDVSAGACDPTLFTTGVGGYANALSSSGNGTGVDFNGKTGTFFAVQSVGTMTGTTPSLAGKIQESSDNISYTDVSGGGFTSVTTNSHQELISFTPTKRYLRWAYTIAGGLPSIPASCVIIAPNQ